MFLVAAIAAVAAAAGVGTVEQWGMWELQWQIDVSLVGNPYADINLTLLLSSPGATTATVRGFYDGGGWFRARFMPPSRGRWRYTTRSNAPALDHQVGHFNVTAPASPGNHGPVTPGGKGSTKFVHADGSPFFAVATTVYGLFVNATATVQSLKTAPFNKVRTLLSASPYNRYQALNGTAGDLTRFNPEFWWHAESVLRTLMPLGIQVELILFEPGSSPYPEGLACLGGTDPSNYNLDHDLRFLRYVVARLGAFRNVWWSMANEWSQYKCKWAGEPSPCPGGRDPSDPGCGVGGGNSPAWITPIWDALFQAVRAEDPSHHLLSIHNNAFLYNYSQPWVTHFSVQHTHNKPKDLWRIYGDKPFMYDEVKYEGRLSSNWGSLSAPQMAQRFWWIAAAGAYGMHGEMKYECPYWSGNGGVYCGGSVDKVAWFKQYMLNSTLHPPFEECDGDDDGYVHTLTCGTDFLLFHFYNGHANASGAFRYIYLPKGIQTRQDLLQPWEMVSTLIWKPGMCCRGAAPEECGGRGGCDASPSATSRGGKVPPDAHVFGPARDTKHWEPVGITVDEDTLPHILTFTSCSYRRACERDDDVTASGSSPTQPYGAAPAELTEIPIAIALATSDERLR